MGEAHLAVVGAAHDHRARAQRARVAGIAERGEDAADLVVDEAVQVGVEVDVVELLAAVAQRAEVGGHPHPHQRVHGGLAREVLVEGRRQLDAEVAELLGRVAAAQVRAG